jgi:hypothetical protein
MKIGILSFAIAIGLAVALVASAPAAQAPFYEGKTLRVLIASGPGGGTDTAGRLVATGASMSRSTSPFNKAPIDAGPPVMRINSTSSPCFSNSPARWAI